MEIIYDKSNKAGVWLFPSVGYLKTKTCTAISIRQNIQDRKHFQLSTGEVVKHIKCGKKEKNWRMALLHEIGHILSGHFVIGRYCIIDSLMDLHNIREEVIAWRIAKSFCKEEYWNEKFAKSCIKGYVDNSIRHIKIDFNKLKIIPLNPIPDQWRYIYDYVKRS